jgi:hypothetical protein
MDSEQRKRLLDLVDNLKDEINSIGKRNLNEPEESTRTMKKNKIENKNEPFVFQFAVNLVPEVIKVPGPGFFEVKSDLNPFVFAESIFPNYSTNSSEAKSGFGGFSEVVKPGFKLVSEAKPVFGGFGGFVSEAKPGFGGDVSEEKLTGGFVGFGEAKSGFGGFGEVKSGFGGFGEVKSGFGGFGEVKSGFGGFVSEAKLTGGFVGFGEPKSGFGGFVSEAKLTGGFVGFGEPKSGFGGFVSEAKLRFGGGVSEAKLTGGFVGFGETKSEFGEAKSGFGEAKSEFGEAKSGFSGFVSETKSGFSGFFSEAKLSGGFGAESNFTPADKFTDSPFIFSESYDEDSSENISEDQVERTNMAYFSKLDTIIAKAAIDGRYEIIRSLPKHYYQEFFDKHCKVDGLERTYNKNKNIGRHVNIQGIRHVWTKREPKRKDSYQAVPYCRAIINALHRY